MISFSIRAIVIISAIIIGFPSAWGQTYAGSSHRVKFHNEATDTTRITQILIDAAQRDANSPQQRVLDLAMMFVDTPYAAGTLDGEEENLVVDLDEFDCQTFVETVLALAITADEQRTSWRDFVYNLERLRYRGGTIGDYSSRLHYFSDWIVDNNHRGNVQEVTDRVSSPSYQVKTLDYMSAHANDYAALRNDSEMLDRIKNVEIGYRSHRYPYIKSTARLSDVKLNDGDLVAITSKVPGLDVQHLGFVVMQKGVPHLLHASSTAGKVTLDKIPLSDYLKRTKNASGIRIIRLK